MGGRAFGDVKTYREILFRELWERVRYIMGL